jgi:hypothetical protein
LFVKQLNVKQVSGQIILIKFFRSKYSWIKDEQILGYLLVNDGNHIFLIDISQKISIKLPDNSTKDIQFDLMKSVSELIQYIYFKTFKFQY